MNRQDIINALEIKGYRAEARDISKNNVMLEAIQIMAIERINPIIYTASIIEDAERSGATVEQVADVIIDAYESRKAVQIDDNITDPAFILANVKIGLQRATDENIVKKPCELDENIEMFLYVSVGMIGQNHGSFKMTDQILKSLHLTAAEIWEQAEKNTFSDITVKSMSEMLGLPDIVPMYVISNGEFYRGASAVLNRAYLKKFAEDHGTDQIIVIPSSVHECILVPKFEGMDVDEITELVQMVNGDCVNPVDQLADRAYTMNF